MKLCYNIYRITCLFLISAVLHLSPLSTQAQVITTVAGNGTIAYCCDGTAATSASIWYAYGVAHDQVGNLYISDYQSHRVRKVNSSGIITTLAGTGTAGFSGDGGPATAAQIGWPYGVAADSAGNVYISDWYYCRVRKVDVSGTITTFAGNGSCGFSGDGGPATAAQINGSGGGWGGIACDDLGNVYFNDNARIRKVNSSGTISTIAGTGTWGYSGDGGPATAAQIASWYGLTCDHSGNIYFSSYYYWRIRKIDASGTISTFAGNGSSGFSGDGGPATAAQIGWVYGVSADYAGNVYLADWSNNRVRRVDPSGIITTIAGTGSTGFSGDGGPATAATFNSTFSVCVDHNSGNIFIGDYYNARVRMIVLRNRLPVFTGGHSINVTVCGNTVFDSVNVPLSVHDSDSWQMATWSLIDGPNHGTAAISYTMPTTGLTITPHTLSYSPASGYTGLDTFRVRVFDGYAYDTTTVYVTVNPTPTTITGSTTFAVGYYTALSSTPSGGTWSSGSAGVSVNPTSGVVTGVSAGSAVITYALPTGCQTTITVNVFAYAGRKINTVAGNGSTGYGSDGVAATTTSIYHSYNSAVDASGNLYIADYANHRVRKVNTSGIISTFGGTGSAGYSGDGSAATAAQVNGPRGVITDASGNVYFSDFNNQRIRKINTSGIISTYAGTGTAGFSGDGSAATAAQINQPAGLAIDAAGNIYFADQSNHRIRRISASGIITTVAGNGTAGFAGDGASATLARLDMPSGVSLDGSGNLYIADFNNHRIRKVNTSGIISTFAGTGTAGFAGDGSAAVSAQLNGPEGVGADALGNIYIGDGYNNRVRKVNSSGVISTVAGDGSGSYGGDDCAATGGVLNYPCGLFIDGLGSVYIADHDNNRIRKISSNRAPYFNGGHVQTTSLCQNSVDTVNSLLAITDIDLNQGETWTAVTGPVHGTISVAYTSTSTGGTVTPTGLYYTPTIGYTGMDSFVVRVYDCSGGSDTTKIVVTVTPPPSAITGASTICEGLSSLFFNLVGTGTWSSSDPSIASVGSTTGLVSGVSAGVAIITFAPGASCTVTKTVTILPSPAAISGSSNICIGTPVTFTDATTGGVWSSSSTAVATVGASTGLVTGFLPGSTTITYTQGGCPAVLPVTVNLVPPGITGVTSICVGETTTLFDIPGGSWTSSNPAIGSIDPGTGVLYGLSAGSPVITYTMPSGCFTTSLISSTINILPLPAPITGPTTICLGSSVTMTDATPSGLWSSTGVGSSATVGSLTGVVTGVATGISTIVYTGSSGCSATVDVTVNAAPAAITGSPTVCVGQTTTLSNTVSGVTWSSSNTAIATVGSSSGIVTGVSPGTVTIVCGYGSCNVSMTVTVNALPPAITGSSSVCVGLTSTYSDAAGAGSWTSGTTSVATIDVSTGVLNALSTGTTTIVYTNTATGCSVNRIITVNTTPGPITGSPSACLGSTTTYGNGTAGGTWSSSTTSVATIGATSGILSPSTTGITTISYSLGAGCSNTLVVTVNPLPAPISGTPAVCIGSTTTLSDPSVGGTWSTSGSWATVGAGTGVVTGSSAGIAPVTYTLTTGCGRSINVTVNALPPAISGPSTVCPGATVNLTDATPGGTWSSSNTSVATIGPSTGVVSGLIPGTTVISYTLFTGCSITRTETVSALPALIGGPTSVCVGNMITLTDATGGGSWSTTSPAATITTSGVLTGVAAGTALVSYTVGAGCPRTGSVTVNPLPSAISGPSALCVGANITQTSPGGGTWTSGTTSVATIGLSSGIVTGITTGTTNIIYTLPTGCTTNRTVTVSLSPVAITGASNVCAGDMTTLTNAVGGGLWTSSNTAIAGVGSLTGDVTGNIPGPVTISYSLGTTGCTVTKSMTVNPSPVAISGTPNLCISTTTTFSDLTPGGAWSTSAAPVATVSSGGAVSGVTVGTATISYTVAGCSATLAVTVNPTPSAISGPSTVCAGATITESNTVPGGTWSSLSSLVDVGSSSGDVTGVSGGAAGVTYSIGSCSVNRTITVSPVSAISGPSGVCVGATAALSASGGGTWISSVPSVASVSAAGLVLGVSAGNTTITYTLPSGCFSIKNMTVNTAPGSITGTASICVGATTLLGNSAGGGTWSSSNPSVASVGSSSGLVNGNFAGNATISYSLGGGCTVTRLLTVNPAPAVIAGPAQVCTGSNVTLTDVTPGGTWSSDNITLATIGATTGVVTGVASGTVIISYTTGISCAITKTMTVNPGAAAISGTANICSGTSTTLSDPSPGGTWSSSNPLVAGVGTSSGLVTAGSVSGIVVITYTLPTGCIAVAGMTVNPTPAAISGSPTVCIGSTTTLGDATSGGAWSSDNISVATIGAGTGVVTGMAIGTATISYLSGSCAATTTVTVNGLPPAITGTGNLCVGTTSTLSNASPGGTWSSSNTVIATADPSSGLVTGMSAGTTTIVYSLGAGCTVTRSVVVNPPPSGILGSAYVCKDGTTTLSDPTPGGTWSSADNTLATVSSSTGVVSGISGGFVLISYTSSATGCSATRNMHVITVPDFTITGNLCAWGDTMTVSDPDTAGLFSSGLATVLNLGAGNGLVTASAPGTATITYTLPTGCFLTKIFTVNPLPAPITGNYRLCTGQSSTLSNVAGGGVWSSTDITVASIDSFTGVVAGLVPGTTHMLYTLPTGCKVDTIVTVLSMPSPISGTAEICKGATSMLSDTASGGIWSSSNPAVAMAAGSGLVTGLSAGTATISYVMAPACLVTQSMIIDPLPNTYTVTGGGNYCGGGTGVNVGLSGSQSGISYQLYLGATATGTPVTGTGSVLDFGPQTAAGVYTVVAVNATTACSENMVGSATIGIIPPVVPAVTISATPGTVVCNGTVATFTATPVNGGAAPVYQWQVNGVPVTGMGASYTYTPVGGDNVKVIMTSNATCADPLTAMDVVNITVDVPLSPTATITATPGTTTTPGGTVLLTVAVINGGVSPAYQWTINGVPVPGATNASFTYSSYVNGDIVKCMVTASNSCGSQPTTDAVVILVVPDNGGVGVQTVATEGAIQVLPNPNKGSFTITGMMGAVTSEDVTIEITNVLGQVVYKKTVNKQNGKLEERVQLSSTPANGMYLLSLKSETAHKVFHIVVEQ